MKRLIFEGVILITFLSVTSITAQVPVLRYVIEKKENKIYLDLGNQKVKIGDRLKVIKEGGFFKHPVTGENIKEEDEIISYIEVIDVKEKYSIASTSSKQSYDLIQVGMKVFTLDAAENKSQNFKKSIVVQPLTVTNVQGYLGMYISDVLTEQLLASDKFRVLDRSTLGIKPEDLLLSSNGLVSESEFLKYPNTSNADYYISGTMYEPDVVEVSSGIPVKSLVNLTGLAVGEITGKDMSKLYKAAEYLPDKTDFKNLRAIVKISLKIIDVKTGEILFICNDMQEASGRSEVNIEGGVLNGLKVKGGAATFGNTITGEATKMCLDNLLSFVFQYFDGKITTKNYSGNTIILSKNKNQTSNKTLENQFIICPFFDEGHIRIGQIKEELKKGIKYEYFSNGKLHNWYLNTGSYLRMENNKIYRKVYELSDLRPRDTIFSPIISGTIGFFMVGYYLNSDGNNVIKYVFQDDNGVTKISTTNLDKVYTIKKGIPFSPYIHSIYPDSLYFFYYDKENRVVTAKVISNLNSSLISHIEFNNVNGNKVFVDCSNRDLYPLNETFDQFRINDTVYFNNKHEKRSDGNVIGYDPLNGTLTILENNSLNNYNIYYRDVSKNSK